jgi:hypothetical protein
MGSIFSQPRPDYNLHDDDECEHMCIVEMDYIGSQVDDRVFKKICMYV